MYENASSVDLKHSHRESEMNSNSDLSPPATMKKSPTLIPDLPNDVARLILSLVPYSHHARIKPTCKSWKHLLSSKSFVSSLRRRNHLLCIFPQDPSISNPFLFDPNNHAWSPLPPTPCNPSVYGLCNFGAISLGPHLYVLGGSLFDTRSFPMDRPCSTSSCFRFNLHDFKWEPLSPMISPRGSFACAAIPDNSGFSGHIIVAGGGSRHTMFGAAGNRIRSAERYDVEEDRWEEVEALPGYRAGCVGFVVGGGAEKEKEFWVMGGYGASRTISGVFPVDEYYRDAVAMELKGGGGAWREVGDMWGDRERERIGKIVAVEDEGCDWPMVFMLDGNDILRYDMSSNRWQYESHVPRKAPYSEPFGLVVVDGELYVVTLYYIDLTETRRSGLHKRTKGIMFIQIYNPKTKTWRSLATKSPFSYPIDIGNTVLSSISL